MENRYILSIVLFFVLGSAIVSSMDSLSYTFKMVYYTIALVVLIAIGLVGIYRSLKKR